MTASPVVVMDEAALRAIVAAEVDRGVARVVATVAAAVRPPKGVELVTREQLGALLQINGRTMRRLIHEGAIPRPIMIAGRIARWNRAAIETWLAKGGNPPPRRLSIRARRGSVSSVTCATPTTDAATEAPVP